MNKLIYVADDEENIRNIVCTFLEREGYEVQMYINGDDLLKAFGKKASDLVILDVMMPGSDGFKVCTELRRISNVPIIMLTARDTDADYITGITLGSDDYFTKPFSPMLLTMRVRAIFRRIEMDRESPRTETLTYADLRINLASKTVNSDKEADIALTPNEFNLLAYLVENSNRAISRDELLEKIWGFENAVDTRVADDTVKRLRRKLSGTSVLIDTVWGFGFRLKDKTEV